MKYEKARPDDVMQVGQCYNGQARAHCDKGDLEL